MFKMMLEKLLSKKWMSLCLFAGILLLAATAVSFPMYRSEAFDRMLREEFRNYVSSEGRWPAVNSLVLISKKDAGGKSMVRAEELMGELCGMLEVTPLETIYYYSLAKEEARSLMNRDDLGKVSLRLGFLSGLPEHAKMLAGEMYSGEGVSEDGCLEAVISQSCMVESDLLIGETIEFPDLETPEGKPVRVRITGVFGEAGENDFYWQKKPDDMTLDCLVEEKAFREYFTGDRAGKNIITVSCYSMFAYEDLKAGQTEKLAQVTDWLTQESPYRHVVEEPAYREILEVYEGKRMRIQATLFLLQIPVLALLGAFLFMISGQMYDMERSDISVMKSRGASRGQILRLYFYQSCFLTVLGTAGGLPLGAAFAGALGSARSFLEFDLQKGTWPGADAFCSKETFLYGAAAMGACILIMTLPAVRHSKISIVSLKRQKAAKKRSWWEICFLDVICLAVALYGYYTWTRNGGNVAESVLKGEAMEPLQYMGSSLFIVGLGLGALRLQPLLLGAVYALGRRFWGPASYISFMENNKNGRKQQFIMIFLIMAVSLGMFHATAARTILENALENRAYLDGADYIVKEVWEDNSGLRTGEAEAEFRYYEPDFDKYARLEGISSYTKVVYDPKAYVELEGNRRQNMVLMGIHTKQFGESTKMPPGLTEKHYYEYLNELALQPDGVLASADLRDVCGYRVGDVITYCDGRKNKAKGKIVDFFTYWPGYVPSVLERNPDGSVSRQLRSMVVAPIDTLVTKWGTVPYEVWMKAEDSGDGREFYRWVDQEEVRLVRYVDRGADLEAVIVDPLLQGTNGILTMGFLVVIVLCGVGYLIYWILSIRSREMLFGILRAGGMHKGEIFHILLNEQIFCGGYSVAAGILIGSLTCRLFVPILQNAYTAADQVLPLRLITEEGDMVRLYGVVGAVLALCLLVLLGLVRKLNVAKALKMGEE